MHGYKYKFALHPTQNIITLKPTASTYLKATAPSMVIAALFVAMFAVVARSRPTDLDAEFEKALDTEEN